MATGRPLLGKVIPDGPKTVWLWNLEDDMEELSRIIQAGCKHYGLKPADLEGRLFVDSAMDGADLKLARMELSRGAVIHRPLADAIVEELRARQIDYLDVDPFVSSHSVDENDNGAIDVVTKEWVKIACRANCAVGLTHHLRKTNGTEATAESARGAVSFTAACRSVLTLNRMSADEAKTFGLDGEERRRFFRVYDDKNNRAPPANRSDWFRMESVYLGNDDSDFGDSVGVVAPWTPPDIFDGLSEWHLLRVQERVDEHGDVRESVQAKDKWIGAIVADCIRDVADIDPEDKSGRERLKGIVRVWLSNGALEVVTAKDSTRRERKVVVVGKRVEAGSIVSAPPKGWGQ